MTDKQAEALARKFHDVYERLAPSFGYETRSETREFDPSSANGRLMAAVCSEVAGRLHSRVVELEEINQQLSEQYDTAADCVKDLQSQLEAIGAGGVESLRKK